MKKKMSQSEKMQSCMTPHVLMHSLFGLGLGILIVSFFPDFAMWWLGVLIIVAAMIMDSMRK